MSEGHLGATAAAVLALAAAPVLIVPLHRHAPTA
ncbi:MAG: hypothetical protein KatS3mg131_3649 [Candidatus Tectimicrobiota bacterium]|nr:MAG: hypothetical protein KatS3mg131_3649 [Candidatus Tectomicrobia bacterium]